MYKLRKYQESGSKDCVDILTSPKKKCMEIVVAPTAAGKSLYIADAVSKVEEPILVLQPSKELLSQNYEKFTRMGGEATMCCSSLKTKTIDREDYTEIGGELIRCREVSRVTYATVGTVKAHIGELKKLGVKRAIIDECHLMTKSGSQIRQLFSDLGITHVVGLTATPIYLQGGLTGASLKMMNRTRGKLFSTIRSVTQIKELVEKEFWTKLVYQVNDTDQSYLEQNSNGSDFKVESLSKFYKANKLEDKIVEEVHNLLGEGRKSILVFVPTIAEAEALTRKFPNSSTVHSQMKNSDRDYIIKAFREMTIPVIFNVNVLSVGFDHPELDAIITARPTASIAVYYQQIGRGVRIHKDKESCKVVDFSGNVKKFGRVEGLHFEDLEGYGWGMFNENNELLTDFPIGAKTRPTKKSLIKKHNKTTIQANIKDNSGSVVLWFGKHKGKSVRQLLKKEKGYLSWMYDNFEFNNSKKKALKRDIERVLILPKTL